MDTPKMRDEQIELLRTLYMGQFPDPYHNIRMDKCHTLFELARTALPPGGHILELGTYHGCGAISLAWGARCGAGQPVHTCDPFVDSHGWIGEEYLAADKEVFWRNTHIAGVYVKLHETDANLLALIWHLPLSLLFWDIGDVPKGRLVGDFDAWGKHIVPEGKLVVKEPPDNTFGGKAVIDLALSQGWKDLQHYPGCIWTLTKEQET